MMIKYDEATEYIHLIKGIVRYSNGIERDLTPEEIERYSHTSIDADGDIVIDLNLLKENSNETKQDTPS